MPLRFTGHTDEERLKTRTFHIAHVIITTALNKNELTRYQSLG